jgi:DNA-binding XRE family transcriptional regulator
MRDEAPRVDGEDAAWQAFRARLEAVAAEHWAECTQQQPPPAEFWAAAVEVAVALYRAVPREAARLDLPAGKVLAHLSELVRTYLREALTVRTPWLTGKSVDSLARIVCSISQGSPEWREAVSELRRLANKQARRAVVHPLARLRREAGLSQRALAAASGVDERVIRRIEAGRSRPRTRTLRDLAEALSKHLNRTVAPDSLLK